MTRFAAILFLGSPCAVAVLSLAFAFTLARDSAGMLVFASCLSALGSAVGGWLLGTTAMTRGLISAAGAAFGFIAYWCILAGFGLLNYLTL